MWIGFCYSRSLETDRNRNVWRHPDFPPSEELFSCYVIQLIKRKWTQRLPFPWRLLFPEMILESDAWWIYKAGIQASARSHPQSGLVRIHPLETCPGHHSTNDCQLLEHFWSVPLVLALPGSCLVSGLNCAIWSGSLRWISVWSPLRETISVFSPPSFPEMLSNRYQIGTQFFHEHSSKIRGSLASVCKHNRSSVWDFY